ncbi:hypothetical protein PAPYR_6151 [Paratrimastix pyriformis]|uniref:Uncharacterized protein n=1 Tax=Paratrimastix pyriformis TaxID=342808 RepID=A0ABQ8UG13_9EUKA|nr:hypothetical protein PAPYR_6151 [Paratrimastix pyriformis]
MGNSNSRSKATYSSAESSDVSCPPSFEGQINHHSAPLVDPITVDVDELIREANFPPTPNHTSSTRDLLSELDRLKGSTPTRPHNPSVASTPPELGPSSASRPFDNQRFREVNSSTSGPKFLEQPSDPPVECPPPSSPQQQAVTLSAVSPGNTESTLDENDEHLMQAIVEDTSPTTARLASKI